MADHLDISIVRAEHQHLDLLVPLFDAYRVFYEQPADPEAARQYLAARLSNLESVIFLAIEESPDGTNGLGFCQLYPSFTSVNMARIWILYDLFVLPEARQRGVGRALMERARHFAQATGASRLELSTAKDNRPAQALYESLGYERDQAFYFYELKL
jgi:ribosomal protein S18 acetylase RimI-like enzyme